MSHWERVRPRQVGSPTADRHTGVGSPVLIIIAVAVVLFLLAVMAGSMAGGMSGGDLL